MGTIEGIKITVSFGHYENIIFKEGEEPTSMFKPDYTYDNEVEASSGCITTRLPHFKAEADRVLGKAFGKFLVDFSKKKEIPYGDRSRTLL
jgi:hypothetical protein